MGISLIVAMDENGLIGNNNDLPWRLPADLKRVKEITYGHILVMGRKNHESIGRPLPERRNVILTRNKDYTSEGCEVIHEPFDILKEVEEKEIFIFGGTEIYKIYLPYVQTMYITRIHESFEGDTYFPEVDMNEWEEVCLERHDPDEKNKYSYTFYIYDRKGNPIL